MGRAFEIRRPRGRPRINRVPVIAANDVMDYDNEGTALNNFRGIFFYCIYDSMIPNLLLFLNLKKFFSY